VPVGSGPHDHEVNTTPLADPHRRAAVAWVEELRPAECWAHLAEAPLGRLGLIRSARMLLLPVNHAVERGTVVFRTDTTSVLGRLRPGDPVVFEVDDYDAETMTGWSVMANGTIELVDRAGCDLENPPEPWVPGTNDVWMRIVGMRPTGRTLHRHRRDSEGRFLPFVPVD